MLRVSPEAGDRVERLYRSQGARLWRALLAFTGNPEIARDAAAEAFAQLLRRGDAVRNPERWLWTAAFRIAAGDLKERGQLAESQPPERSYEMEEPARELVAALRRLSPNQRASVVLHHAAGYSVKDIARILGSTQAAVKVHLGRGRKRLRQQLEEEDTP